MFPIGDKHTTTKQQQQQHTACKSKSNSIEIPKEFYEMEIDGDKQLFKCKKCEEVYLAMSHLSMHLEKKHGIMGNSAGTTYICDICGKQCNCKRTLGNHIR
jgi:hypothetical protein